MQETVTGNGNGNGHDAAQDQELLDRLGTKTEHLATLIAEDYQRGLRREDDWSRTPDTKTVRGDFTDWMNLISSGIRPVIYALDEFLDYADLADPNKETLILSLLELARKQLRARGCNSTLVLRGMAVEVKMLTEMHAVAEAGGAVDVLEFAQDGQYGELAYMAPWFDTHELLAHRIRVVQGEMRRIIIRVDNAKRRGAFWDTAPLLRVLNEPDADRSLGGITHLLPYFAVAYIDRVKASAPGRALGHIQAVLAHQLEVQTQQTMAQIGAKVAGREGQQAFLEALT